MISLTAGLSWGVVGIYQSVGPGLIGQALGVDSLTVLGGIVAIVLTVGGIVQIATRRVPVPAASAWASCCSPARRSPPCS